jgi:hypothetical protein
VVYKVDRLSRSLLDLARIIEIFDRHDVSFVAVTQQLNTTSSLGGLPLNSLRASKPLSVTLSLSKSVLTLLNSDARLNCSGSPGGPLRG